MRTWLSIARGRAAEDVYSDSKWKWMTTDCPGMGWEGELSSGWGMLAGLSRSLKMSFVTLLLSSPFSRGKKPQQAWARAGEDGRSGGKGLKRAVRVSPAAMGDRAKASACVCSWRGAAVGHTSVCAEQRNALMCRWRWQRALLLWSLDHLPVHTSNTICLFSRHLFFEWRGGLSTHMTAKQRN